MDKSVGSLHVCWESRVQMHSTCLSALSKDVVVVHLSVSIPISPLSYNKVNFDWEKKPRHRITSLLCRFKSVVLIVSSAGCKLNWRYSFPKQSFLITDPWAGVSWSACFSNPPLCWTISHYWKTPQLETCLWLIIHLLWWRFETRQELCMVFLV